MILLSQRKVATSLRMRKLTPVVLLLMTVTTPSYAVDYVQCREMLRTKNEMLEKARAIEGDTRIQYLKEVCPEWGISNPLDRHKAIEGKAQCQPEYLETVILPSKKPVYKSDLIMPGDYSPRLNYYNTASVGWVKSAEKVASDMKKGNCPYE